MSNKQKVFCYTKKGYLLENYYQIKRIVTIPLIPESKPKSISELKNNGTEWKLILFRFPPLVDF
jgi:hypothetical protein